MREGVVLAGVLVLVFLAWAPQHPQHSSKPSGVRACVEPTEEELENCCVDVGGYQEDCADCPLTCAERRLQLQRLTGLEQLKEIDDA